MEKPRTNELGQPVGAPLPDWNPPPFPEESIIEGRFCRLEPLDTESHAAALFAANARDESGANWTYLPYGPFSEIDEYTAWVESVAAESDPQFYAVISAESGVAAGVLSLLRIKPEAGSIEVGHIHFSPLIQKTPAATEAIFLLMERAFTLGYRRFEWKCDALNAPSCSAAERLGLSFEGVFRNAIVTKNRNRDSAWFAVIDSDWPALEAAFQQWLAPENFDESGAQRVSFRELTAPILKCRYDPTGFV